MRATPSLTRSKGVAEAGCPSSQYRTLTESPCVASKVTTVENALKTFGVALTLRRDRTGACDRSPTHPLKLPRSNRTSGLYDRLELVKEWALIASSPLPQSPPCSPGSGRSL